MTGSAIFLQNSLTGLSTEPPGRELHMSTPEGLRGKESGSDEGGAAELARLARAMQAQNDVNNTLRTICQLAVHLGPEHAGVTLVERNSLQTPAASDALPEQVDAIQYATGQGPCVEAVYVQDVAHAPDFTNEQRWPEFTAALLQRTPVRSMLSHRLYSTEATLGALNFYSTRIDAFPEATRALIAPFATRAAIALQAARDQDEAANLRRALDSNRRIGIAIGILMAQEKITESDAFHRMRIVSQHSHRKLREVAEDVVHTGTLEP